MKHEELEKLSKEFAALIQSYRRDMRVSDYVDALTSFTRALTILACAIDYHDEGSSVLD